MPNLNHFVCPNCGRDFYQSASYATCDGCGVFFYFSQSQRPTAWTFSKEAQGDPAPAPPAQER